MARGSRTVKVDEEQSPREPNCDTQSQVAISGSGLLPSKQEVDAIFRKTWSSVVAVSSLAAAQSDRLLLGIGRGRHVPASCRPFPRRLFPTWQGKYFPQSGPKSGKVLLVRRPAQVLFGDTFRALTEPCGVGYRDLGRLSDEELMRHLIAGHDDALKCLFDRYHRLVLSIGLKVLRDEDEAQDLVQEVFFNLYRTAGKFDPEKGTTKMWIIRGAYRQSLSRRRYLKVRGFYDGSAIAERADEPSGLCLLSAESALLVGEILGKLSRQQRRTLRLAVFGGLTTDEIATRTGEKVSNVRHHYYRGLTKLRAMLLERASAAETSPAQEAVDARS